MKKMLLMCAVALAALGAFASGNGDANAWPFDLHTDGDSLWYVESTSGSELTFRSGAIGDNQKTRLYCDVEGPANISFRWKVSSEDGYDKLRFLVKDMSSKVVFSRQISGNEDWALVAANIPQGKHTASWIYEKDGNYSEGTDCGWVKEIDIETCWKTVDNPDGTVTLTGSSTRLAGDVIIPSKINGKVVSAIGKSAFSSSIALKSLTIPSSIKNIGDSAFYYCKILSSVTLEDADVQIGFASFDSCERLRDENGFIIIGNTLCSYRGNATTVTVPSNIKAIGGFAFGNCTSLTSVSIPDSVTQIGDGAFSGCSGLKDADGFVIVRNILFKYYGTETSVTIPNGVTRIDRGAFSSNSSLTSVTIPAGVTAIGPEAFYGCTALASVNMPSGVTAIGQMAFYGCTALASVNMSSGVTNIGSRAFNNCTALTSVNIPSGVTTIGDYAFVGCGNLLSLTIPGTVKSIGNNAFSGCSKIASLSIQQGVEKIGSYAFRGCVKIPGIEIPTSVTFIGDFAFYGCSGLTAATVPSQGVSIGSGAFRGCDGLTNADGFLIVGGMLFAYSGSETAVTVPSDVTAIGDDAFSGNKEITSVKIPAGVVSIGSGAFASCAALKTVRLPDGLIIIGDGAFRDCAALPTITFPKSLKTIGDSAFLQCFALSSILIPDSVETIGSQAFWNCTKLQDSKGFIIIRNELVQYCQGYQTFETLVIPQGVTKIGENALSGYFKAISIPDTVTEIGEMAFWACRSLEAVILPPGVKKIPSKAFLSCSTLTSVTLPEGVVSIGKEAFSGCTSLPSIAIPEGVYSIGDEAFSGCTDLSSVTIPEGVIEIGKDAFKDCKTLTLAAIPGSISEVGQWFSGCDKLKAIILSEGVSSIGNNAFFECCSALETITFPKSLLAIANQAFCGCGLKSVVLPETLEFLGDQVFLNSSLISVTIPNGYIKTLPYNTFASCKSLKSVTIQEGLTEIDEQAFAGCSALTSFEIPYGVTKIGKSVFANCTSLSSVTIPSSVRSIGSGAFWCYYNPLRTVTVYLGDVDRVKQMLSDSGLSTTSLKFVEINNPKMDILTQMLPVGKVGVPYDARLSVSGGEPPYTWSLRESGTSGSGTYAESREDTTFSSGGAACGWKSDDQSWELNLPFDFNFYGKSYSKVYVSSNGTLSFGSAFSGCNESVDTLKQKTMIAVLWDDLKTTGGDIYTLTSADVVTIRWDGVYYNGGAVNFSATLCRDGTIRLSYGSGNGTGGLIGVSSGDGIDYTLSSSSQSGSMNNARDVVFRMDSLPPHKGLPEGVTLNAEGRISGVPTQPSRNSFAVVAMESLGSGTKKDMTILIYDDETGVPDGNYQEVVNGLTWTFVVANGLASVGGPSATRAIDESTSGDVTIPEELGGRTVTQIGSGAFSDCDQMTSITIPKPITKVGRNAFSGCTGLRKAILFNKDLDTSEFPSWCEIIYAIDSRVEFDLCGHALRIGGGELVQTVHYGESAVAPTLKVDEGWRFTSWDRGLTNITEDTTISALYQAIDYKITYVGVGDLPNENVKQYTIEDEIVFKPVQNVETARFVGWTPSRINRGTTGDLVVVASWETKTVSELMGGITDISMEGDADWYTAYKDDAWTIRSGVIGDSQKSTLVAGVSGAGIISFKWKASSEAVKETPIDCGEFRVDGMLMVDKIGGETGWLSVSVPVSGDKRHDLTWTYAKDRADFGGEDCVWIKDVMWTPEVQPIEPGGEIKVPEGKAEEKAAEINSDPAVKAQYLKAPGGIETTKEYRDCFNAVATSGSTVEFVLNEEGTNQVVEATTAAKTSTLESVLSKTGTLVIGDPLIGFYYSLKQGSDVKNIGFKVEGDKNKIAGKDAIEFTLDKPEGAGFYQSLVTPTPVPKE